MNSKNKLIMGDIYGQIVYYNKYHSKHFGLRLAKNEQTNIIQ